MVLQSKENIQDEQLPYYRTDEFDDNESRDGDAGAINQYQQMDRLSAYVLPSYLVADHLMLRPPDNHSHSKTAYSDI